MDIFEAARTNAVDALQNLLKTVNPNIVDSRGSTPLIVASYFGNIEAAKLLLAANANPNILDSTGNTALMGVAYRGHLDVAELLLSQGASVDTLNGNQATALTFAATFGQTAIVKLLLEYGANPLIKDRFQKNPIDYAQNQENEEAYELLVAALKSVN